MSEDERRALWAAALGVPQDELYGSKNSNQAPAHKQDKESLRRAG